MPILDKEVDLFPADLFEVVRTSDDPDLEWWVFYTGPRQEKRFMRRLMDLEIPFYGPVIPHRYRSPSGRLRTSYIPLFTNYVFVFGDEAQRYHAMTSGCASKWFPVPDKSRLTLELDRIRQLIGMGRPLTPESRLIRGDRVRVTSGGFMGFEGTVIRRNNETRLLIAVDFMQQGVSVALDDCQIEPL